jgi:hypothetical protein
VEGSSFLFHRLHVAKLLEISASRVRIVCGLAEAAALRLYQPATPYSTALGTSRPVVNWSSAPQGVEAPDGSAPNAGCLDAFRAGSLTHTQVMGALVTPSNSTWTFQNKVEGRFQTMDVLMSISPGPGPHLSNPYPNG